jgi:hypothetical protein
MGSGGDESESSLKGFTLAAGFCFDILGANG